MTAACCSRCCRRAWRRRSRSVPRRFLAQPGPFPSLAAPCGAMKPIRGNLLAHPAARNAGPPARLVPAKPFAPPTAFQPACLHRLFFSLHTCCCFPPPRARRTRTLGATGTPMTLSPPSTAPAAPQAGKKVEPESFEEVTIFFSDSALPTPPQPTPTPRSRARVALSAQRSSSHASKGPNYAAACRPSAAVVGFTDISAQLPPEGVMDMLGANGCE